MTPEDEGEAKEQREWAAILEEERLKEEEVRVFSYLLLSCGCSVFLCDFMMILSNICVMVSNSIERFTLHYCIDFILLLLSHIIPCTRSFHVD